MADKRFYYCKSSVYGWAVYDREIQMPAYDACAELLPPVSHDETGTVTESPVLLVSEFKAMHLAMRLNSAHRQLVKDIKSYWMQVEGMGESRQDMESIWSTNEGMADLMDWWQRELDAGLTLDEMRRIIK